MKSLVLIKLSDSVITDKTVQQVPRLSVIRQLVSELGTALRTNPELSLILAHGAPFINPSRTMLHFQTDLIAGTNEVIFAKTAGVVRELNRILVDELLTAELPAFPIQPSASLTCEDGNIKYWNTVTIQKALYHKLLPVTHNDAVFDIVLGSSFVSVEQLFSYLTLQTALQPSRIIVVEEDNILNGGLENNLSTRKTSMFSNSNIGEIFKNANCLGVDNTASSLRNNLDLMWLLVETIPGLEIQFIEPKRGFLERTLLNNLEYGGITIRK